MTGDTETIDEDGKRRLCQACFRTQAEHHCQACRRFVCDDCVASPQAVGAGEDPLDFMEVFVQASLTRCKACRDDDVQLPPHDVRVEGN